MACTVLQVLVLVALAGIAMVRAAYEKVEELRYDVPVQIRDTTYPVRDTTYGQLVQPHLGDGTYLQPVVQPSNQMVQPHKIIVVDDRSRNQVAPTAPTNTLTDGHTHIGNTICVNRDDYEEFMGWKYGRNQGGGDNGNRSNYRRNGNYGRGGGYRRG